MPFVDMEKMTLHLRWSFWQCGATFGEISEWKNNLIWLMMILWPTVKAEKKQQAFWNSRSKSWRSYRSLTWFTVPTFVGFTSFTIFLVPCLFALYIVTCLLLRLKDFPKGLGKGFDAALIGAWLEHVVGRTEEDMIPVSRFSIHQPSLLFKCIQHFFGLLFNASQYWVVPNHVDLRRARRTCSKLWSLGFNLQTNFSGCFTAESYGCPGLLLSKWWSLDGACLNLTLQFMFYCGEHKLGIR